MPHVTKLALALLLVMGAAPGPRNFRVLALAGLQAGQAAGPATFRTAAANAPDIPFTDFDASAEQLLLALANQARRDAGVPPLAIDAGLSQAARAHAEVMVAARQLSHRLDGEPTLPQRLAEATNTKLDQEGENVAFDYDAEHGHQHLMLSPPHRANLLNAAYNVVGLGVLRSGNHIYIVQDFGHALPNYSADEVKDRIASAIAQARHQSRLPDLSRIDLANADEAACSMAEADKLGTLPIHQLAQHYTVLTYTSLHPETLPANSGHAFAGHNLHSVSIGACYARTNTYPTGAYWVVLALD